VLVARFLESESFSCTSLPHFLNLSSISFPFHLFFHRFASDFDCFSSVEQNQKQTFLCFEAKQFSLPTFARFASEPKRAAHPASHSSIPFYLQIRVLQTKTVQIRTPNIFLKIIIFIYFRCSCGWWASYFLPWLLSSELSPPTSTDSDTSPGTAHPLSPGKNFRGDRQVRKESWSLRAVSSERHQSRNSTPPESR
jgi:hypothetical protein